MSFQKLGIGTRNPNKTLDVSGSVHISETIDISGGMNVATDIRVNDITIGRGPGNFDTNTAIGYQALYSTSSAVRNTAYGYQALSNIQTGSWNTAIGYSTFESMTSGWSNIAVGYMAGMNSRNSTRNLFLGFNTGFNNIDATYADSIALGANAKITASNQIKLGTNTETVVIPGVLNVTGTVSGITKTMVDLGNVDNTSDNDKQVSTPQRAALDLKANIESPEFTGTPSAPTATSGTNTSQLATTAFVQTRIGDIIASAPAELDTLNKLASALGDDANFSTTITNSLSEKAPLESPTFTGTVSGITKTMVDLGNVENTSDNDKPVSILQLVALDTKADLSATDTSLNLKADLDSPTFTGKTTLADVSMNGNVDISGNLTVTNQNNITVINTTVNQYTTIVTDDISLNGNLNVSDELNVTGDCLFNNIKLQGQPVYSQRLWEVDLTGLNNTYFYPVIFTELPSLLPINFKITGLNDQSASDPYNDNTIMGSIRTGGWTDKNVFFDVHQRVYSTAERRFIGIYSGYQGENTFGVYMRGGYGYSILTDSPNVTLYNTGYTDTTNSVSYQIKNSAGTDIGTASLNILRRIDLTTGYADQRYTSGSIDATSYNASSDYRIKENIVNISDTSYNIDKLRPVTYKNTKSNNQDFGVIAHELQEQIPFLVTGKKDGETHQSVNYNGLIGILIHEVQQIKKRNSYTMDQNAILQSQLDNIMTILNTNNLS
jgi:hypothetical protein